MMMYNYIYNCTSSSSIIHFCVGCSRVHQPLVLVLCLEPLVLFLKDAMLVQILIIVVALVIVLLLFASTRSANPISVSSTEMTSTPMLQSAGHVLAPTIKFARIFSRSHIEVQVSIQVIKTVLNEYIIYCIFQFFRL